MSTPTDERVIHDPEVRAAYLLGREHGHSDGHAAGMLAAWEHYRDAYQRQIAALNEQVEPQVLAEVARRVARMLEGFEGGHGGHARTVARFVAASRHGTAAAPHCDCGDWARGYFWRDAMARHGGVIEAQAAGLDLDAEAERFRTEQGVRA